MISKRTRDALQAKKAQGFKLGSPQGFVGDAQTKGPRCWQQRAQENLTNRQGAGLVRLYRAQEHSYQAIAQKLNALGYRTRQGQAFQAMTVWRLARLNGAGETKPEACAPSAQMTTVTLWLQVENNSKFVRGKKRAREDIEFYCLRRQSMKKLSDWEYELTFTYRDEAELDQQVYDLLQEIELQADLRHCFTEADVRENGTERSWSSDVFGM